MGVVLVQLMLIPLFFKGYTLLVDAVTNCQPDPWISLNVCNFNVCKRDVADGLLLASVRLSKPSEPCLHSPP